MSAHQVIFENGLEQHAGRGGNLRQAHYRVYPVEKYANLVSNPMSLTPAADSGIYDMPLGPIKNPPKQKQNHSSKPESMEDKLMYFVPYLVGADLVGMYLSDQSFMEVATALDGGAGYALGAIAYYMIDNKVVSHKQEVVWYGLAGFVPAIVPLALGGNFQLLALMGLGGAIGAYVGNELVRSKYF